MTQTIPNEAIEAAARAAFEATTGDGWEKASEGAKDVSRFEAQAALTAALPHLSASDDGVAVERAAQAIYEHWQFGKDHPELQGKPKPDWVPRGNAIMQNVARDYATAALSPLTPANLPGTTGGAEIKPCAVFFSETRELVWDTGDGLPQYGDRDTPLYRAAHSPQATDEAAKGGAPNDIAAIIQIDGDGENTPAEALNHALARMHSRGEILSWMIPALDAVTPARNATTSKDVALWAMLEKHIASYQAASPGIIRDAALSALLTLKSALASLNQPEARKTGSADGALREADGFLIQEREDTALICERTWMFPGWRCIAQRPKLMSNEEWRADAERIITALSHIAASTHSPTKTDGEFERGVRAVYQVEADGALYTKREDAERHARALLPADKKERE